MTTDSARPVIELRALRKQYGDKEVLKGIDLQVQQGEVIGYIGPNGAGKSTTVKIITGLLGDFEGEVLVNGISVKENPLATKRLVGYVPELAELYEVLTPKEFLEFVGSLHGLQETLIHQRMQALLGAFGIGDRIDERMESFSKGMKQKVLLTSGLLHNPDILILDEPLSGLDANSVIIVKDLIGKLAAEGKTIIYCSHMMDVVEKVSDRIVLISDGQILANGSFAELQALEGNQSLEKIFSQLTASQQSEDAAEKMVAALQQPSIAPLN